MKRRKLAHGFQVKWEYKEGKLQPAPAPALPFTSIHATDLGASPWHNVALVDVERDMVVLAASVLPHPWNEGNVESSLRVRDWGGPGWYATYRRAGRKFELQSVAADKWVFKGGTTA